MKTRRRACSNYGKNECNEICWGGTCCWPDSVYTHFFFSCFFFCRTRIEFLSISPFFLSWLVTVFPCRPRSNYRNGPTSLVSPLFFSSSRAFTESFVFSRLGRFFFFLLFFYSILSYAPIHPFEFFFFAVSSFSMSPTSQQKKNSGERKRGGWTP